MKKLGLWVILLNLFLFFGCSKYDKQTSLLAGKDWVAYKEYDDGTSVYGIARFYPEGYYVYFYLDETTADDADIEIDGKYYKIYVNGDRYPEIEAPYYEWGWVNEMRTEFYIKYSNIKVRYYRISTLDRKNLVYYYVYDGDIWGEPYEYEVDNSILKKTERYNYKDYYKLFIEPALEEQTNN